MLVDASQSMAVEDEKIGERQGADAQRRGRWPRRRRRPARRAVQQHDVSLVAFDAAVRRVAQWKRHKAATAGRDPDARRILHQNYRSHATATTVAAI